MGPGNKNLPAILLTVCCVLVCMNGSELAGQVPIQNGEALESYANGMYAPTQMAFDSAGNLFCASGYEPTWPMGGTPTPIFKITPDGTTSTFSMPVGDPDSLAVSAAGDVYVGSWGGKITKIDGLTENQSIWLVDGKLKNIDGLRFSPAGDLFAVAIDSSKVHKIDFATKNVVEFADLASVGVSGMSGIAFQPGTGRIFVESPWEGFIVELAADGSIVNPSVASGFQFLGFIDFDPSGRNPGYLFAPDAITGEVYKVDVDTGEKILVVDQIIPGPVGLTFDSEGVLYFNQNFDQVQDGVVYNLWDMQIEIPANPFIGNPLTMTFQSRFDEFIPYAAWMGRNVPGPILDDGRQFPLDINALILLTQSLLDGTGEDSLTLEVPNKPQLIGKTFYFVFTPYQPVPFWFLSFSKAASITIQ